MVDAAAAVMICFRNPPTPPLFRSGVRGVVGRLGDGESLLINRRDVLIGVTPNRFAIGGEWWGDTGGGGVARGRWGEFVRKEA